MSSVAQNFESEESEHWALGFLSQVQVVVIQLELGFLSFCFQVFVFELLLPRFGRLILVFLKIGTVDIQVIAAYIIFAWYASPLQGPSNLNEKCNIARTPQPERTWMTKLKSTAFGVAFACGLGRSDGVDCSSLNHIDQTQALWSDESSIRN